MLMKDDADSPAQHDQPFVSPVGAPARMPRIGPWEAVKRYKLLTALPVLVLLLGAFAYGFGTNPKYTAESYQSIGRLDVSETGGLGGFKEATESLAATYSRGIYATSVVNEVSQRTGRSPDYVRSHLASFPVPDSAIYVVVGTGSSEDRAVELSVAGTQALQDYVEAINADNPNSVRLFDQFRAETARLSQLAVQLTRKRSAAGATPSPDERQELIRIQDRIAAVELRRDVARINYAESQNSQNLISLVQDLVIADEAKNDRWERLQMALFIAVAAGLLIGIALATWRANREVRRVFAVA